MRWTNVACSVCGEAVDQLCHEAPHKDQSSSFAILMHSSSTQQLRPDSAEQDGQHGTALSRYLPFTFTLSKSRSSWFRVLSIRNSYPSTFAPHSLGDAGGSETYQLLGVVVDDKLRGDEGQQVYQACFDATKQLLRRRSVRRNNLLRKIM